MAGAERAESLSRLARVEPFEHQLADHGDERRIGADGLGPHHVQADLAAHFLSFGIEIEDHLQVIGNETDRHDDDVGRPSSG